MDYNYLLLADGRFISYAISELRERLGISGRIKTMALGREVYLARIELPPSEALKRVEHATFFYGLLPVIRISEKPLDDGEMVKIVAEQLSKDESFRLELVSLGAKRGESAKTTEVRIGRLLESAGFIANLSSPQKLVYTIIGEGITVVAAAKSNQVTDLTLDHFRLENKDQDTLNRAEVKIKEAFDNFGLGDVKTNRCLDIGASPGGWTNFLVKRGAHVIAIDRGALEYDRLATTDVKVFENLDGFSDGHMVSHLRMNLSGDSKLPLSEKSFDLLAIDINTDYLESAKIATSLSRYLKPGGLLIMTLKLPKISDAGRIYLVNEALAKEFRIDGVKKLHHNRMELTLLGRRL